MPEEAAISRIASSNQLGYHPGHQKGVAGPSTFQFGDFDAVNLYNGNLTLKIPLGISFPLSESFSYQLNLVYNSKVWKFIPEQTDQHPPDPHPFYNPDPNFNAGMGWWLSLGKLIPAEPGSGAFITFIGSDGAQHLFFDRLHPEPAPPAQDQGKVFYTRDGSYLRLRVKPNGTREVDFPDGTTRVCNADGNVQEVRDPFGNFLKIAYTPATWTLTDRLGRTHRIQFDTDVNDPVNPALKIPQVMEIQLQAFNTQTAVYKFEYEKNIPIARYWRLFQRPGVNVPFLTKIILPDLSFYSMDYYKPVPFSELAGDSGKIKSLTLPTGGKYEWSYGEYNYWERRGPAGDVRPDLEKDKILANCETGVVEKKLSRTNGQPEAVWRYRQKAFPPNGPNRNQIETTVTSPLGNDTVHYFYQNHHEIDSLPEYHGLPFTPVTKDTRNGLTLNLSKQFYQGLKDGGRPLREEYVLYLADPGSNMNAGNPRLKAARTLFKDDGNRYVENFFYNFDGFGHFRQAMTRGDFTGASLREEENAFNSGRGIYDYDYASGTWNTSTFKMIASNQPWLLNLSAHRILKEAGKSSKTRFFFNATTGFLMAQRVQQALLPGDKDLLQKFTADASGNLGKEEFFGGDMQRLPTPDNYNDLIAQLGTTQPEYAVEHIYQNGVRSKSRYLGEENSTLYHLDRDIDFNTGLAKTERDSAGVATAYEYDLMYRLIRVKPEQEAHTKYTYAVAHGQTSINTRRLEGNQDLTKGRTRFDDFGRVWRENVAMKINPDLMATRETKYNVMGWKDSVSERGFDNPSPHKTQFLNYDPFGRPRKIKHPDDRETALEYAGARQIIRKVKIGTGRQVNGNITETLVTVTEIYDIFNRLVEVREPSGANGATLSIFYEYDYADRLVKVRQQSGSGTQERLFEYDNRGLLTGERHPEKGANGNGWVRYLEHDSKGHARRQEDGPNLLLFAFDREERLRSIKETGSNRSLKEFIYANANNGTNKQQGKLRQAVRYNYGIEPWSTNPYTIKVVETYTYAGRMGRVSERLTEVPFGSGSANRFSQSFEYDALGNVRRLAYPNALHAPSGNVPRTVEFGYSAGLLKTVKEAGGVSFANDITYHANGLLDKVFHGNGWQYFMGKDPHDMPRPESYGVINRAGQMTKIGPFSYDGAGNIMRIVFGSGYEDFIYDSVSRLKKAVATNGEYQEYTFDPFGNITNINTKKGSAVAQPRPIAISAQTNRLAGVAYDGAGNQLKSPFTNAVYTYDALNMIRLVETDKWRIVYLYTATDERLWSLRWNKVTGQFPDIVNTWSLRDLDGRLLRQYRNMGNSEIWTLERDYIHRGQTLLASISPTEGIRHYHSDHLGTPRLLTDGNGNVVSTHFYLGFGEEFSNPAADNVPLKFTGHERDSDVPDDPLDYMHARFYSSKTGRFLSTDPAASSAKRHVPQSWNQYVYALNNPMKFVDPDGRQNTPHEDITQGALRVVAGSATLLLLATGATLSAPVTLPMGLAAVAGMGIAYYNVVAGSDQLASGIANNALGPPSPTQESQHSTRMEFWYTKIQLESTNNQLRGALERREANFRATMDTIRAGHISGDPKFESLKKETQRIDDRIAQLRAQIEELRQREAALRSKVNSFSNFHGKLAK
jgi:RHS repeat-associated protein